MTALPIHLEHPERMLVPDGTGGFHHGCDQEWYGTFWKRAAGCGPCVASNLALHLHASGRIRLPMEVADRTGYVGLMEFAWRHVTPNLKGVSTLRHFCGGMHGLLEALGSDLACRTLEVPPRRDRRPAFPEVVDFIAQGLSTGSPVAFLNRSNGSVENLESWHWVTIVSLEPDPVGGQVLAGVYDAAKPIVIDLTCWHESTTQGGGFLYVS